MASSQGKKVFVGLSGGVDSAVSAALLKDQGFDVTGVFIKVWHPDFLPCSWREERRDAMRVAAKLDIPFLFFDFEKEYKSEVADFMIDEYRNGRTPNPDILCNKVIKFGSFWQKSKELGADFIATGHYARISKNENSYELLEGKDKNKDQSYFLWMLKESDLEHTLFPIGDLEKESVRKLASKYDLPVAEKKDSQGICFIGDVTLEEFLSHFIDTSEGNVLNERGEVIGKHKGAVYYTIGERKKFEINKKEPDSGAFYVISKDISKNTITVSNKLEVLKEYSPKKIVVSDLNWISKPDSSDIEGRIRYRQQKIGLKILSKDSLRQDQIEIEFKDPQNGLSFGQSVVFYYKDECLGGGIMKSLSS